MPLTLTSEAGSSILSHAGSRGANPHQNFFFLFRLCPECITRVKYKINHISKTNNHTKNNSRTQNSISEHCVSYEINIIIAYSYLVFKHSRKLWTKSLIEGEWDSSRLGNYLRLSFRSTKIGTLSRLIYFQKILAIYSKNRYRGYIDKKLLNKKR